MGNDPIIALAREARLNPEHVVANLGVLTPAERASLLAHAVRDFNHEPYRRYTPDRGDAVRQLVANEYVSPPDEQRWQTFFVSQNANANLFNQYYQDVWNQAFAIGQEQFFSEPHMLTYVLQTISTTENPASLLKPTADKSILRQEDLPIPGLGKIPIYICSAMELLTGARSAIVAELSWMRAQGYRWPGAIMVKADPGGSRQTDREPCAGLPKLKGSHLRIGAVAERMPCTLRHEDMHEVRAQLSAPVLKQVDKIYNQAMTADSGLIFNDEYYMKKFLHAGHPMQNSNEFFAGAAHAFTHHADEMVALIQSPDTPKSVRTYAIAMWRLLRDDVFHHKVFTQGETDPFR